MGKKSDFLGQFSLSILINNVSLTHVYFNLLVMDKFCLSVTVDIQNLIKIIRFFILSF